MAKKDIEEYYNKVCNDYTEMLDTLTDMEEAFNTRMISEEQLNQVKQLIVPLKNNYMTLSWVMYLLNKPARKEKFKTYDRQMAKFKSDKSADRDMTHVLKENSDVIESLKNFQFDK